MPNAGTARFRKDARLAPHQSRMSKSNHTTSKQAVLANVTAVSLNGKGILIEGKPGSGKSSLALSLIDRGAQLIGDDAIQLELRGPEIWASPPPNIAGLIEVRGLGLVEMPMCEAPIHLILQLGPKPARMPETGTKSLLGALIPTLPIEAGVPNQALIAELALSRFGLS